MIAERTSGGGPHSSAVAPCTRTRLQRAAGACGQSSRWVSRVCRRGQSARDRRRKMGRSLFSGIFAVASDRAHRRCRRGRRRRRRRHPRWHPQDAARQQSLRAEIHSVEREVFAGLGPRNQGRFQCDQCYGSAQARRGGQRPRSSADSLRTSESSARSVAICRWTVWLVDSSNDSCGLCCGRKNRECG